MITKTKLLFLGLFIFTFLTSKATTWDEPWQDQVIKQSDYFVLAKIQSVDEKKRNHN
jgi:hypothetical protein